MNDCCAMEGTSFVLIHGIIVYFADWDSIERRDASFCADALFVRLPFLPFIAYPFTQV